MCLILIENIHVHVHRESGTNPLPKHGQTQKQMGYWLQALLCTFHTTRTRPQSFGWLKATSLVAVKASAEN